MKPLPECCKKLLEFVAKEAFSREPMSLYSSCVIPAEELVDEIVAVYDLDKHEVGEYIEQMNEKHRR